MPSDGYPEDRDNAPRRPRQSGRTAYVPLNRGPRMPAPDVPRPAGDGAPRTVEAETGPGGPPWADGPDWANDAAWADGPDWANNAAWANDAAWAAEQTGPGLPAEQTGPGPHDGTGAIDTLPGAGGGEPGPLPAGPLPDGPPPDGPPGPDTTAGATAGTPLRPGTPPHPPATRSPGRRWRLVAIAAVAVLLGATAAVLANDGEERTGTGGPQAGPSGAPAQTAGQPSATPGGVDGLGQSPSAQPSTTPGDDFQPFAAPRKTLPGASLHLRSGEGFGDALRRSDRTYGPLRMVRVFYPGLPPSWNGSRADVANRTVVVSFKAHPRDVNAGRYDSRLAGWFASVPRNVDVYWAYYHEPENDVEGRRFTPAQFASAFRRVSGLADKARNPRLRATLILMCWTLSPNSGRNFDAYYPGSAAVDVLGWDCYNTGVKKNRYAPPTEVFSRMIDKSRALGKPWGLAETGTLKISGDSSGSGRATWLRSVSRYLNEQKPLWVAYYDYKVGGGDYRLLDAPSQNAWRAWCAASPA